MLESHQSDNRSLVATSRCSFASDSNCSQVKDAAATVRNSVLGGKIGPREAGLRAWFAYRTFRRSIVFIGPHLIGSESCCRFSHSDFIPIFGHFETLALKWKRARC